MQKVTFEKLTGQPVFPTQATVTYDAATVTVATGADWLDVDGAAGDLKAGITSTTLSEEFFNDLDVKISASTSTDLVTLKPGVWRVMVFISGVIATAAVDYRVAVTDDTATGTPTTYLSLDTQGNSIGAAGENGDVSLAGLVKVEHDTNIRLVIANGVAGGAWTTKYVRVNFRRLCDYVAS